MEFFIRNGASEPILKLALIDDGLNDKSSFNELLETSEITLDMYDVIDNEPIILSSECFLTTKTKKFDNVTDEYFIIHRFTEEQTEKKGRFEAIITIQFKDTNNNPTTKLIVPISEKLFINII